MNKTVYKQYDDRWGKLPYPGGGSYLSDSGCGCLAVYHAAIELESYKNLTVPQCRKYMVQYATVKNGTLWSGIEAGLKHYGFNVHWKESDTMADVFRELKSSMKMGVILFAKPDAWAYGPDGTLWTKSGHYIFFGDYEIRADGKHWFYLKDSGSRNHSGWFCFEKSMKGCCRNVYICKSAKDKITDPVPTPDPEPTPRSKTYEGNYPVVKKYLEPGDRGENVIRLQNYLDWYYNGAFFKECGGADSIYGKNTLRWVNKMLTEFFGAAEADGKVGPKTIAEMKRRGGYNGPVPKSEFKMIDVSSWQKKINWKKVKASGIVGAIIRYADDDVIDNRFKENMKGAISVGLHVGVYIYSRAKNKAEAERDAVNLYNACKPYLDGIDMPMYIDLEQSGLEKYADKVAVAFLNKLKKLGIKKRGVYANLHWWNNYLTNTRARDDVAIWVAQWESSSCDFKPAKAIGVWQYSSKGKVAGINADWVDMDICYIEYWKAESKPESKPDPIPAPITKGKYPGKLPSYRLVKSNAEVIADTITFAKWIAANNDFHYGHGDAAHKCGCYFCKTQPKSKKNAGIKMYEHSQCCNPFVHSCFAHGGCIPSWLAVCLRGGAYDWNSYPNLKDFKKVKGTPKAGDIVCSSKIGHTALSLGGNKVIEASGGDDNVIHSKKWNNSIRISTWSDYTAIYRYIGSVDADVIMRHGEVSKRVLLWQDFLNWWSDGKFYAECGKGDGIYGDKTYEWTVKFQEKVIGKGTGDGTIGSVTLKAAANYTK